MKCVTTHKTITDYNPIEYNTDVYCILIVQTVEIQ